jgi:soluble lytic murein transglycosylase-like protein
MSRVHYLRSLSALVVVSGALISALVSIDTTWGDERPSPEPQPQAAAPAPQPSEAEASQQALCTLIETAAADNNLPLGFFTRLIWKESRFRGDAVSPKGAQGIAQFMPGTAAERGLEDPFDATSAIPASALFLAELRQRFGNLGLAAAAYNAGADRVSDWLADASTLPFETQNYVVAITGVPAATWADPNG